MAVLERMLLCTDGEEHTRKAEDYAFHLAKGVGADLVGLYDVDPFLKKFTNEIYAVNRDECRDHGPYQSSAVFDARGSSKAPR
jgi:hypothetical protein